MASCGPKDISPAQAAPREHTIAPAAVHGGAPMGASLEEMRARGGIPVICPETGRVLGCRFPQGALPPYAQPRTSGRMQSDPNTQRTPYPSRGAAPAGVRSTGRLAARGAPAPQQQRFAAPPPQQQQRFAAPPPQQQQQQFADYAHGGDEYAHGGEEYAPQQTFFEHGGELVDPAHDRRVADMIRSEVSKQLGIPQRGMYGGAAAETEEVAQHGGAPAADLDIGAADSHDIKTCVHGGCDACTMDHPSGCRCGACARVYSRGFWEEDPNSVPTMAPPRAAGRSSIPDPIRAVPASTVVPSAAPMRTAAPPTRTLQAAQRPAGAPKTTSAAAPRTARPPTRR